MYGWWVFFGIVDVLVDLIFWISYYFIFVLVGILSVDYGDMSKKRFGLEEKVFLLLWVCLIRGVRYR